MKCPFLITKTVDYQYDINYHVSKITCTTTFCECLRDDCPYYQQEDVKQYLDGHRLYVHEGCRGINNENN